MATFRPNIDLLSIPGAKPLTINEGTADKPRNVNYICIPADVNEISIERSRNDESKLTAYLPLMMRPLSQRYIDSIVENKQRRGDAVDMNKIESHEITLNHTPEFMKVWAERVAAKVLKDHPDWQGQNSTEKVANGANDLYYEVRRIINKRIGKGYPVLAQQQSAQPAPMNNFGAPAGVNPFEPTGAVAAAAGTAQQAPQMAGPGEASADDLPF